MKILELFSGTGSVGKVCKSLGIEVVSLDRDLPTDIKSDIMDWDYKTYKPKDFDLIWVSPPLHRRQSSENHWGKKDR